MSRVGKKPIPIPDKTNVTYANNMLTVRGEKGVLTQAIHPDIDVKVAAGTMSVALRANNKKARALQGMTRSLAANMITGVDKGFQRILEINGIGYRAELKGKIIVINVGYSNPVEFELPEGVSAAIERNNIIKLFGIDKQKVGATAAAIRKIRPPEPYKGKGIKYVEEHIRRKAGKAGTK